MSVIASVTHGIQVRFSFSSFSSLSPFSFLLALDLVEGDLLGVWNLTDAGEPVTEADDLMMEGRDWDDDEDDTVRTLPLPLFACCC